LYAKTAGAVTWSGGMMPLRKGQSIDENHALAKERPDLFTDKEPGAEIQGPDIVRSAMQRPGENRMERTVTPPVVQAPPRNA
jgi:hypothetical protein